MRPTTWKGRLGAYILIGLALLTTMVGFALNPPLSSAAQTSLLSEIHSRGQLRVCYALAEPQQFKDLATGQWKGIAVDIMKDWAQVQNVKHVPVDVTWATVIAALQAGKCDVASALNRRPARALAVTFSVPYVNDIGVFAVNATKTQARNWSDINRADQTICVIQGSAEDLSLRNVGAQAKLLRLADLNECRIALQSGRATATFAANAAQAAFAARNQWVRLIVPNPAIVEEGIAFAIRKGYSYDDIQALDIEVEHWISSGLLTAAYREYRVPEAEQFIKR